MKCNYYLSCLPRSIYLKNAFAKSAIELFTKSSPLMVFGLVHSLRDLVYKLFIFSTLRRRVYVSG
jgi:hypothetical protein